LYLINRDIYLKEIEDRIGVISKRGGNYLEYFIFLLRRSPRFSANHNWLQVTLYRAKEGSKKSYIPSIAGFVLHHNDLSELGFSGELQQPG
jgi:hypothetical protein